MLAKKLKKIREKKNLSMAAVSRLSEAIAQKINDSRAAITQGYISRLESGREDNPSLLKLMTLTKIYKIKISELAKD